MITVTSPERTAVTAFGRDAASATFIVAVAAAAARYGSGAAVVGAVAAAASAAWIDARTGRIPDRLVALSAIAVVSGVVSAGASRAVVGAVVGAVVAGVIGCAGPLFVAHLVSPPAVGFGDVKLAVALGGAVGLVDPRLGLLALCVATGGAAIHGLVRRRHAIALGPWLAIGTLVALGGRVWE